jgi:hypothetical protein
VKAHAVHTILYRSDCTGTEMTSGLLGLKFLLKMPQRQTIDLWEQVVSCSSLEYPAATITPEAFQETADISSFYSFELSRF